MPDGGDAKVFEIVSRQLGQDLGVNLVLPKRLLVALQPQLPQPSRDVHKRPSSGGDRVANSYQSDGSEGHESVTSGTPPIPTHNVRCAERSRAKGAEKLGFGPDHKVLASVR